MRYRNDGRANLRMRCVLLLLALLVAAADAGSSKADKYKRLPKATPAPDTGSQHGDHEEHPMFADNVYELESRARAGALMHAHHASVFGLFRERHGAAARAFAEAAAALSGGDVLFAAGPVNDVELRHTLNTKPLDPRVRLKKSDERDRVRIHRGGDHAAPIFASLVTDAQALQSKDELVGLIIDALGWTKMSQDEVDQHEQVHGEL